MLRLFIGIVLTFLSQQALASGTAILKGTETYKKGSSFVAELVFSSPVDHNKASIEYINQTVQLNIRGVSIAKGKSFKKINDEKVKSLYTYQIDPQLMRTRVIYKNPIQAKDFEGFVHLSSDENRLKIVIEDPMAVASTASEKKQLPVIPPVDLNAELEEVEKSEIIDNGSDLVAAAAQLESEFLRKVDPAGKQKRNKKVEEEEAKNASSQVSSVENAENKKVYDEASIPLNLGESKDSNTNENPWFRMILSLAIVSVVGIALIFVAKRYSRSNSKVGGNIPIRVVSQQAMGGKKSLAVVRVAGEDILIGVTDYNISMIKSLSFIDDEVEDDVPRQFVDELNKVTDKYISEPRAKVGSPSEKKQAGEDFNIGSIKDMVATRLKEMRPL